MRLPTSLCAAAGALGLAASATAAPNLDIRGAAAQVVVIPEARADVTVTVLTRNPALPLRITHFGDRVSIVGDLAHRIEGCPTRGGRPAVRIAGRGTIGVGDLPRLVAHVPVAARVSAGDAVFGVVGRSASLDFVNRGCGEWTVANVLGPMRINQAGAGRVKAGRAGSADFSVAGAGQVATREIAGGAIAISSGSGDIAMASVTGPFNARVAGSGDVRVANGRVTRMVAAIAGSGSVRFGGEAQVLSASVAGSGLISVAEVTGAVSRRVLGSGAVRVGRQANGTPSAGRR